MFVVRTRAPESAVFKRCTCFSNCFHLLIAICTKVLANGCQVVYQTFQPRNQGRNCSDAHTKTVRLVPYTLPA
eukprot:5519893-Amphidinium_carterae.3